MAQEPPASPAPDPNDGVGLTFREPGVKPMSTMNITYLSVGGHDSQLDVYQQPGTKSSPVLLYFHGGGWWRNHRPMSYHPFQGLLNMGFSVVNVGYRLTPDAAAPAAVQDARCALAWVKKNRKKYRFDVKRVAVYGTSSGGHLALMAGMLPQPSDIDLPQCRDLPKVAAVLDFYGIADVNELLAGPHVRSWANRWIGERVDREDLAHAMSPLSHVRPEDPAIFIVHGDADPTVPYSQSLRLEEELKKAGVPVQFYTVKGGVHGKFDEAQMHDIFSSIRQFLVAQRVLSY
jgi:acetyl esterase/lipase